MDPIEIPKPTQEVPRKQIKYQYKCHLETHNNKNNTNQLVQVVLPLHPDANMRKKEPKITLIAVINNNKIKIMKLVAT